MPRGAARGRGACRGSLGAAAVAAVRTAAAAVDPITGGAARPTAARAASAARPGDAFLPAPCFFQSVSICKEGFSSAMGCALRSVITQLKRSARNDEQLEILSPHRKRRALPGLLQNPEVIPHFLEGDREIRSLLDRLVKLSPEAVSLFGRDGKLLINPLKLHRADVSRLVGQLVGFDALHLANRARRKPPHVPLAALQQQRRRIRPECARWARRWRRRC